MDATPEEFGAAMVKCQHPLGMCAQLGECYLDGECFRPGAKTRRRIKELRAELKRLEEQLLWEEARPCG